MRLSDEELKAGFLHPSRVVRGVVANHFTESFTRDPDVTRWAIRGVEEYGWDKFLVWQHKFCNLPLIEASSFEWVCQQLKRTDADAPSKNQKLHLSTMLAKADTALLERLPPWLMAINVLRAKESEAIATRIQLTRLDPEECWQRLEEHCRRAAQADSFAGAKIPEARWLLEPLVRAGDRFVPRILEVLRRPLPDPDVQHSDHWLIGLTIILAGYLRLDEAAPLIWDHWKADWDWYNEEVMYALARISTPSVVRLARERYPNDEKYVRNFAHNVFETIRCEEAVEAIESVIVTEDDEFLRGQLGVAAAAQFDDRAATLARQLWDEDPGDPERGPIQENLLAFAHLSGWELPERDDWEQKVQAEDDRMARMRDPEVMFGTARPRLDDIDREILADEFDPIESRTIATGAVLRRASRVGRNDPCPCGSGKKYKKCCLLASAGSSRLSPSETKSTE